MAANSFFDWALMSRFQRYDTVRSGDVNAALDEVTGGFTLVEAAIAARNGVIYRGNWVTATQYTIGDLVRDPGGSHNIYYTNVSHTSGVLATDIAAGRLVLYLDVASVTGSTIATEVFEPRATYAAMIVTGDIRKKIRYTGAGNAALSFDAASSLGAGWKVQVWNDTSGYLAVTADGFTYRMYPNEIREFYVDLPGLILRTLIIRPFAFVAQSAGSFVVPYGYNAIWRAVTGSGQGGGGGGGGGSGRGISSNSGSGGSGASGGAAGQNGQTVMHRFSMRGIASTLAVGSSVAYTVGAAGTKGTGGAGGVGALSGAAGNNGTNGTDGGAGNPTTFGASAATDAYFLSALGGAAGANKGLAGLAGNNNNAGGAAVTNTATVTAGTIDETGAIAFKNAIGPASTAGTNQASVAPGTAGGAGGDSARTVYNTAQPGGAGGAANAGAVPSVGNAGTSSLNVGVGTPGQGGGGGGGGGGSPGVGGGASAATGAGGAGGDGSVGAPGQIEIWGEA